MTTEDEFVHKLDRVAVEAYCYLSTLWRMRADESARLLDVPQKTFTGWCEDPGHAHLNDEHRVRISHVINIFADLHTIFDNVTADDFLQRPNAHFAGQRPLDRMLDGIEGLLEVRAYVQHIAYDGS